MLNPVKLADRAACRAAVLAIRAYQLVGRRFHSRRCLYAPSCSARAAGYFAVGPFRMAWRSTRDQLARCNGNYSLRLNARREVEMVTDAGDVVPEAQLSPAVVRKLKRFADVIPPVSDQPPPPQSAPTGV